MRLVCECGRFPESCICPLDSVPYSRALLRRMAENCSTPRVRADLLRAAELLDPKETPHEP